MESSSSSELIDVLRHARVLDVDMSTWYREVRLVIHAEETHSAPSGLSMCVLGFQHVKQIEFQFNHGDWPATEGPMHWWIYEVSTSSSGDFSRSVLSATPGRPVVDVTYKSIDIRWLSEGDLRRHFPLTGNADTPFLRRGVEALLEDIAAAKRSR
jgi:hypothetical protein